MQRMIVCFSKDCIIPDKTPTGDECRDPLLTKILKEGIKVIIAELHGRGKTVPIEFNALFEAANRQGEITMLLADGFQGPRKA